MKVINVTRCQFDIMKRIATGENLEPSRHTNGTFKALGRKKLIAIGVQMHRRFLLLTELGLKVLANRGIPYHVQLQEQPWARRVREAREAEAEYRRELEGRRQHG